MVDTASGGGAGGGGADGEGSMHGRGKSSRAGTLRESMRRMSLHLREGSRGGILRNASRIRMAANSRLALEAELRRRILL